MSVNDELQHKIEGWDGKSADDIRAIYRQHSADHSFLPTLLSLIEAGTALNGATWLLKAFLEDGNSLSADDCAIVYGWLGLLKHWEAKLHILQVMPHLPIAGEQKAAVEAFLRRCISKSEKKKFVRAWAYSGFHTLAQQHPEYRDEVNLLLADAVQSESASVRARIRNLRPV